MAERLGQSDHYRLAVGPRDPEERERWDISEQDSRARTNGWDDRPELLAEAHGLEL